MVGRRFIFRVTGHGLVLGFERRLWILPFHFGFVLSLTALTASCGICSRTKLLRRQPRTQFGVFIPSGSGRGAHRRFSTHPRYADAWPGVREFYALEAINPLITTLRES